MSNELKEAREISGIYFRFKNPNTGSFENRVFEDLPEDDQDRVMDGRKEEWLKSLAKQLAASINRISEQFGIQRRKSEDEQDEW